ncbi:hypothetical protein V8G54_003547 [Vigna mungo]|uniref:Uncharacterized protein n=1 Tax=Vigna mungo TaxID=3915 RepID=A0AAQ3PB40_VIGMU
MDQPQTTQEFVNDIAKGKYDRDFKSNFWIWVEMLIKHYDSCFTLLIEIFKLQILKALNNNSTILCVGLLEDGNIDNVIKLQCGKSMVRLPFVACIVKELGEMDWVT